MARISLPSLAHGPAESLHSGIREIAKTILGLRAESQIAIDEAYLAGQVEFDGSEHIVGVDAAVRAAVLPGGAGVVFELILLELDLRVGEEVHAVGV